MKNDEFNQTSLRNEKQGIPIYEFGSSQGVEFSIFKEKKSKIKDEVNASVNNADSHTKISNSTGKISDQAKKIEQLTSSSTGISSTIGGVGAIGAATTVGVATLSTAVGINLYFHAKFNMNVVDVTPVSIKSYSFADKVI